jgi:hypothetical protein
MGADLLDLAELPRPREQVMRDLQRHLAGDDGVGVDETVQGDVDRPFGGVLHRHHPVFGAAALDLVEDLGDGAHGPEGGGRAEARPRRLVGIGGGRTQIHDGERVLERQRGGEHLPPDRAERVGGQRTTIQRDEAVEDLGLALRNEVGKILLPLELADVEGGVCALIEEG